MIYRLAILNGDRRGQQITVPEGEALTIGRGADCGLCLHDPEIASTHAAIEQKEQGLHIRDLGSMGKLLVNNHAVRDSTLKHGDVVELGHTRMLVQAVVEAEVRTAFDYPQQGQRRRRVAFGMALVACLAFVVFWRNAHEQNARKAAPSLEPVIVRIPSKLPPVVAEPAPVVPADSPAPVDAPPPAAVVTADEAGPVLAPPPDADAIGLVATVEPEPAPAPAPAEPARPPAEPLMPLAPEPDPYELAQAVVDDKVRGMMMEAHLLVASNQFDKADALLSSVLHLAPNHAEAYVERAWLYEDRGMLEPAMEQWREVVRLGGDNTRIAMAQDRVKRLAQARNEIQPKFGGRVRVLSTEQMKFPESQNVREMRMVTVHLAPSDTTQAPDAEAVRVDVLFYDRDLRTGTVRQSRAAGENQDLKVSDPWRDGETKTVTATYVVPSNLAPAGTRGEQFYGYVVRVYHFGALQDSSAQPSGLLARAGLPGGQSANPLAESEATAFRRITP